MLTDPFLYSLPRTRYSGMLLHGLDAKAYAEENCMCTPLCEHGALA